LVLEGSIIIKVGGDRVNTEELLAQMELDELKDELSLQTKATPINYAKARGIRPQKVYTALRSEKLSSEHCPCGRRVVDIVEADEVFGFKKETDDGVEE
jgi:hypothetical protein